MNKKVTIRKEETKKEQEKLNCNIFQLLYLKIFGDIKTLCKKSKLNVISYFPMNPSLVIFFKLCCFVK